MKKITLASLALFVILNSCFNSGKKENDAAVDSDSTMMNVPVAENDFNPLEDSDSYENAGTKLRNNRETGGPGNIDFPVKKNISNFSYEVPSLVYSGRGNILLAEKYLVIIEPSAEEIFSVFELPDLNYLGGFGKRGRGPNEFPFPDALSVDFADGHIRLYDVQRGIAFISLDNYSENNEFIISKIEKLPGELYPLNDAFILNDSTICGQPYADRSEKAYVSYNPNTTEVTYFGEYPSLYPESRKNIFWQIFGRQSVVKPDETKFASFCRQVKMFRIYGNDKTLEEEIIIETQEDLFEGEWIRKNPIKYYGSIRATNEYIYALCENQNTNDLLSNKPTLEIWDWGANPIASLSLDRSIGAFDVTLDNKIIYGTDRNVIDSIYTYDISFILE